MTRQLAPTLAFLASLYLAGCGGSGSAPQADTGTAARDAVTIQTTPFPFTPDIAQATFDKGGACGAPTNFGVQIEESSKVGRTIKHLVSITVSGSVKPKQIFHLTTHQDTGGSAEYDVATGKTTVHPGTTMPNALTVGDSNSGAGIEVDRYDGNGECHTPSTNQGSSDSGSGSSSSQSGDSCNVPQPTLSSATITLKTVPHKDRDRVALGYLIHFADGTSLAGSASLRVHELDSTCAPIQ